MLNNTIEYWVKHLALEPHPEGGYYRELYRAQELIAKHALPDRFSGPRSFATSIVYLLGKDDFSAFHRICSDETWHFYSGDPLELFQLDESKPLELTRVVIGNQLHLEQQIQWTVPAGVWFAAKVVDGGSFSVLGCSVSPGFDFNDFQLAKPGTLERTFPQHCGLIGRFTHD